MGRGGVTPDGSVFQTVWAAALKPQEAKVV